MRRANALKTFVDRGGSIVIKAYFSPLFNLAVLMRMRRIVQFALFSLVIFNLARLLSAQEVQACSVQKRMHPTSDNIPTITDPDFILKPPGDILDMGTNLYSSLALTDTVIIGVAEGERHEMLGSVEDIEIDADGRIFIVGRELGEVLYCSSDGSYLGFFD